jgi:hypothetical protein
VEECLLSRINFKPISQHSILKTHSVLQEAPQSKWAEGIMMIISQNSLNKR